MSKGCQSSFLTSARPDFTRAPTWNFKQNVEVEGTLRLIVFQWTRYNKSTLQFGRLSHGWTRVLTGGQHAGTQCTSGSYLSFRSQKTNSCSCTPQMHGSGGVNIDANTRASCVDMWRTYKYGYLAAEPNDVLQDNMCILRMLRWQLQDDQPRTPHCHTCSMD